MNFPALNSSKPSGYDHFSGNTVDSLNISSGEDVANAEKIEIASLKSLDSLTKALDKKSNEFKFLFPKARNDSLILLEMPAMTPDSASIFVMNYLDESNAASARSIQKSLLQNEESATEIKKQRDAEIEKRHEAEKRKKEEQEKSKSSSNASLGFGTASFIIGVLAIIAGILTGGALSAFGAVALGMAIAGAAAGGAALGVEVANRVLADDPNATETDPFGRVRHKQISIGRDVRTKQEAEYTPDRVAQMTEEEKKAAMEKLDKTESDVNTAMQIVFIVFTIVTSLPSIVVGISAAASKLAKVVVDLKEIADKLKDIVKLTTEVTKLTSKAKMFTTISDIAGFAVEVCESISDIASAGYGMNLAEETKKVSLSNSRSKLYDQISNYLKKNTEILNNELKKNFSTRAENAGFASRMNSNYLQAQASIISMA